MLFSSLKNIVVVGGSYVGLRAALELAKKVPSTHRVLLIEPHSHFHHLFAFPRIAVAPGFEHKGFIPLDNYFEAQGIAKDKILVVRAAVQDLRRNVALLDREVHGRREVEYEYAVIATGTKLPSPGTIKAEDKLGGIQYFQQHQKRVEQAQRIVILGGGAVGVQMATDIKDIYPSKDVTLVHSRDKVMNRFHSKLHEVVAKRCEELGIRLVLGDRAVLPDDGFPVDGGSFEVELQSGKKLEADFVILSVGQKPQSGLLQTLSPSSILSNGFVSVKPTLQIVDSSLPHVFLVGDIAEAGVLKSARCAEPQAVTAAQNILKLIAEGTEASLDAFNIVPSAIHMSLGITRDVIFRNPRPDSPEPVWEERDNGVRDLRIEGRWTRMGASTDNFYL